MISIDTAKLFKCQTAAYRPPVWSNQSYWQHLGQYPFTWHSVEWMRLDPQVKLGMKILAGPLLKPKITVSGDPKIVPFVERQIKNFWSSAIPQVATAMWYTRAAGEIVYKRNKGLIEFDRYLPIYPTDVTVLTSEGQKWGIKIKHLGKSNPIVDAEGNSVMRRVRAPRHEFVTLAGPKSFLYVHNRQFGSWDGRSELEGAYVPWLEKNDRTGARDSRKLWFFKNSFGGGILYHPPGNYKDPSGTEIPYRDLARAAIEQAANGSTWTFPNTHDQNGQQLWRYEPPTTHSDPVGLLNYLKDLDVEILRGMGIPDDVISQVSGTGSFAGRTIPLATFFQSLNTTIATIVDELCEQVLKPLVWLNFQSKDFQVSGAEVDLDALMPQTPGQEDSPGENGTPPDQQQNIPQSPGLPAPKETDSKPQQLSEDIQAAAEDTDPDPSEAQRKAGNYRKGKFTLHGMPVTLETPKGCWRKGTGMNGTPWKVKMRCHYGYIRRTEGNDGDHVDVFVGEEPETEVVFVLDQNDPDGRFDEHKAFVGFPSEEAAQAMYLKSYTDKRRARRAIRDITPMTLPQFKHWLEQGDLRRPVSDTVQFTQLSFEWTEEDEKKHPRAKDGTFAKKGEGESGGRDSQDDSPPRQESGELTKPRASQTGQDDPRRNRKVSRLIEARAHRRHLALKSPYFKQWFKSSKVVDENGQPKEVYHGTSTGGFGAFEKRWGQATSAGHNPEDLLYGPGIYFTENEDIAKEYSELNPKTIFKTDASKEELREVAEKTKSALEKEYQAWVDANMALDGRHYRSAVGQLQELLDNSEELSPDNQDVLRKIKNLSDMAEVPHPVRQGTTAEVKNTYLSIQSPFDVEKDYLPFNTLGSYIEKDIRQQRQATVDYLRREQIEYGEDAARYRHEAQQAKESLQKAGVNKELFQDTSLNTLSHLIRSRRRNEDVSGDLDYYFTPEQKAEWLRLTPEESSQVYNWREAEYRAETNQKESNEFAEKIRQHDPPGAKYEDLVSLYGSKKSANEMIQSFGHDGLTHIGGKIQGYSPHRVWIAFEPNQIKSVDNEGTFDSDTDALQFADWTSEDERKHPRDQGGQFTQKTGAPPETDQSEIDKQDVGTPDNHPHAVHLNLAEKDYPQVFVEGQNLEESLTEDEYEQVEEVGDPDEVLLGLALNQVYSSSDLEEVSPDTRDKLLTLARKIRENLEYIPVGQRPFTPRGKGTYFRIHSGPMQDDDLHNQHQSKLWFGEEEGSTRNGLSVTGNLDDLEDYFRGQPENSLGRGAHYKGAYIVELRGDASEDEAYEASLGERLIHPQEIVQQRPVEQTGFLRNVAEKIRGLKDGEDGVIFYDDAQDVFRRINMGDDGKVFYSDL